MTFTDLEFQVLHAIAEGMSPWFGYYGTTRGGVYSAALRRLVKKGAIVQELGIRFLTPAGKKAYDAEFERILRLS